MKIVRLSIPGNECVHCKAIITEKLKCSGCGWFDTMTRKPETKSKRRSESMKKHEAREIAETITNEQLAYMFKKAKAIITDWNKVSKVNKGLTKGVAWNILASNFDLNEEYHILTKTNMVREFGEFLPDEMLPDKKSKSKIKPSHANPDFSNW